MRAHPAKLRDAVKGRYLICVADGIGAVAVRKSVADVPVS